MTFLTFVIFTALLLFSAFMSGNVGYFINIDSIVIVLIGIILFMLSIGKWRAFWMGIRMTVQNKYLDKLSKEEIGEINRLYRSLVFVPIFIGLLSTIQGMFSGFLALDAESATLYNIVRILCLASFTTVYGLLFSVFIFLPIKIKTNKSE